MTEQDAMTELTRLTAVETAAAIAGEGAQRRRGRAGAPRPHRRGRRPRARLPARRRRGRAARRPSRVDAGELSGPLAGVPLALKDVVVTEGVPTTVGSRILEGWRPPYDATVTAPAQGRRRRAARQDQHGRVRDGLVAPRTPPTARRATRGTSPASPAAPAAARRRRSRRTRRRSRSAPTPAARSASRPRSPAPSGSSRPTAASRATAWSRSPAAWTRPARARAPCSTPRCCTR